MSAERVRSRIEVADREVANTPKVVWDELERRIVESGDELTTWDCFDRAVRVVEGEMSTETRTILTALAAGHNVVAAFMAVDGDDSVLDELGLVAPGWSGP